MKQRKIHQVSDGKLTITVYRDPEWMEYICKPSFQGKALHEAFHYHTDDRQDAIDTATNFMLKGIN